MKVSVAYSTETHIHPESGLDRVFQGLMDKTTFSVLEPADPPLPEWLRRRLAPPLGQHPRMDYYEPAGLRLEWAVIRKLLSAPGEVVHLLQGDPHFNLTAWTRLCPRRGALVASFHQPPAHFERAWRFRDRRRRFAALDHVTASSRELVAWFQRYVDDRVSFVPLGVNRRVFNPPARPRPARAVLPGPEHAVGAPAAGAVRCISVGAWLRDPALLRATIDRVTSVTDRVAFTVLGPPAYLARLGEPPRTTLAGGLRGHDLVEAYHAADLFVHPAALSTASTAVVEAMATGLPIVTPDVGGVRDYLDESSAVIVAPSDPDALAGGILQLAADPARRAALGASAEARSRALDWPHIAHEYVQAYAKALARRGEPVQSER